MRAEEIVWILTSAGHCELGSAGCCSVNVNGSSSQAADGIRRERLRCKIVKERLRTRWQKYQWEPPEGGGVTDGMQVSSGRMCSPAPVHAPQMQLHSYKICRAFICAVDGVHISI